MFDFPVLEVINRSRELPALKIGSEASRHYNKMIKDIINRVRQPLFQLFSN